MHSTKLDFYEQIEAAFLQQPDMAGVIHGSQRPVLRGAPDRVVSLFSSRKTCGSLLLEGVLERAAAICLESSDVVLRYVTQALRVTLSAKHFVIPDFVVERCDGSYVVIEVKSSIKGLSDEKRQRYEMCGKLLDREGIEFRIIDSYMLPTVFEFHKINKLYVQGHQRVWSSDVIDMAMDVLNQNPSKKIQHGRLALASEGLPGELCDYLVFHKKLSFLDAANTTVEIAA